MRTSPRTALVPAGSACSLRMASQHGTKAPQARQARPVGSCTGAGHTRWHVCGRSKPPGATQPPSDVPHTACCLCVHECRDRAEERRKGVNPDYESANQLLQVRGGARAAPQGRHGGSCLGTASKRAAGGGRWRCRGCRGTASGAVRSSGSCRAGSRNGRAPRAAPAAATSHPACAVVQVVGSARGDIDPSKLSVEESKYLGGDLEHTHLVKGLDFALLNKVRAGAGKGGGERGSKARGICAAQQGEGVGEREGEQGRGLVAA